jgi:uncharacterized membrane protein YhaH (DUF805 family)
MTWYLKVLKQYADFIGRARRKEYWMFFLFHMLFTFGTAILSIALDVPALMFAVVIYVFASLVPGIAVSVRRMHDIGKSGWYALLPYYNVYLLCLDSEQGNNQFGRNPKETQDAILQKV